MNVELLHKEFLNIKKRGYIKAVGHGTSAVGRTFEDMLRIKENSLAFADYFGIEIKCFTRRPMDFITLFSQEPESQEGNVIKKIAQSYGYPDREFEDVNILNTSVSGKTSYISLKYKANTYYDKNNLYILIKDRFGNVVDSTAKWSMDRIKSSFEDKCEYLAVIDADKKTFNGVLYIKYKDIKIYKFKGIDYWLKQLSAGNSQISFKVSLQKTGYKKGELHNHGTAFQIRYNQIETMFDRII